MKRIVKETLSNSEVQYRVQSNKRFFGLITCKWYTVDFFWNPTSSYDLIRCKAVFKTLEEAKVCATTHKSGE